VTTEELRNSLQTTTSELDDANRMASSLPPPPPPSSSLDPLATTTASPAALKAPKSSLPLFLTLSLLLIPYFFLSLHLGLDPRNLPPPLPSLFLVLSTFITLHLLLPHIVVLYAPQTPKGRYGAQWTATNLNVVAGSILWCLVIALKSTNDEKKATDAAVGISVTVVVVMLFVINVGA